MKASVYIVLLFSLCFLNSCSDSEKAQSPKKETLTSTYERQDFSQSFSGFLDEEVAATLEIEHKQGLVQGVLVFSKTQSKFSCQGSLSPLGQLSLRFMDDKGYLKANLHAFMRTMNEIEGEYLPVDGIEPLYLFLHQEQGKKMQGPGELQEDVYPGLETWRHRILFPETEHTLTYEYPQVQGKERFNRLLRFKFLRDRNGPALPLKSKRCLSYSLFHHHKSIFSFLEQEIAANGDTLTVGACNFFVDGDRAWDMDIEEQFTSLDKIAEMIQELPGDPADYPLSFYMDSQQCYFLVGNQSYRNLKTVSFPLRDLRIYFHPASPLYSLLNPDT